jgi:hypothetical protein
MDTISDHAKTNRPGINTITGHFNTNRLAKKTASTTLNTNRPAANTPSAQVPGNFHGLKATRSDFRQKAAN